MTARIRRARPDDAEHLPAIEQSAGALFRTIPDLAWIADDDVMSAAAHRTLIAHGAAWVAERMAQRAGFLAAERVDDALHIWELAVHAAHQGRGLGRDLMETARAHARATGCAAVTLTTFRDLEWNEAFYVRLGFVTLDGDDRGARLTALLEAEARNGLPRERRCAMRLAI